VQLDRTPSLCPLQQGEGDFTFMHTHTYVRMNNYPLYICAAPFDICQMLGAEVAEHERLRRGLNYHISSKALIPKKVSNSAAVDVSIRPPFGINNSLSQLCR
jgi:hypothetical protein